MSGLFASGHAVDIVLAVMLIECIVLARRGRAKLTTIVLAILPGALILLALRVALTGGDWWLIALFLAAAFPVQIADLRRRRL